MAVFKRAYIIGAVLLALSVIQGATPVVYCSAGGYGSHAWELTQAFSGAMRDQEMQNRYYLLPALALVLFLLGAGIFWFRAQKKSKTSGRMRASNSSAGHDFPAAKHGEKQRAWLRASLNRELLYTQGENGDFKKGRVVNIGGGGLLFATSQELEINDELKIIFELTPGKELNLAGRVVRITESRDSEGYRFLAGVKFIKIRPGEQDSIVREIFQRQQEVVLEEKRKTKGECVLCGKPLPEEDKGVRVYCRKCRP